MINWPPPPPPPTWFFNNCNSNRSSSSVHWLMNQKTRFENKKILNLNFHFLFRLCHSGRFFSKKKSLFFRYKIEQQKSAISTLMIDINTLWWFEKTKMIKFNPIFFPFATDWLVKKTRKKNFQILKNPQHYHHQTRNVIYFFSCIFFISNPKYI